MSEEHWPAWATEAVRIRPYDDAWPLRAARHADEVAATLGDVLTTEVHHVGSTAVPGLCAKPIIDLMAGVDALDEASDIAAERLSAHDWHLVPPDLDDRPWRRFLIKVSEERRAAHLHLMEPGTQRWRDLLRFRDVLRGDSERAAEYAALKQRLAAEHGDDREAYSHAKADFVRAALEGKRGA